MKQLQNNYTTPEQSKRLLQLGLPADSADCYYSRMKYEEYENPKILYMKYSDVACFHPKTFIYLPCWSVGRLIEIFEICTGIKFKRDETQEISPLEDIIAEIDYAINVATIFKLDFSKLELV